MEKAVSSWETLRWNATGRHFCWCQWAEWPRLGPFMTFSPGFATSIFVFLINLDQFVSPFLCIQPRNTYKNWELEAVWLNICSVWMHLFVFFSKLGAPKIQVFFPYQYHHFLCSFLGFLFWDISTLAHAVQKQLQINTSMQTHRFVLLGNRILKFESFLLSDPKNASTSYSLSWIGGPWNL